MSASPGSHCSAKSTAGADVASTAGRGAVLLGKQQYPCRNALTTRIRRDILLVGVATCSRREESITGTLSIGKEGGWVRLLGRFLCHTRYTTAVICQQSARCGCRIARRREASRRHIAEQLQAYPGSNRWAARSFKGACPKWPRHEGISPTGTTAVCTPGPRALLQYREKGSCG